MYRQADSEGIVFFRNENTSSPRQREDRNYQPRSTMIIDPEIEQSTSTKQAFPDQETDSYLQYADSPHTEFMAVDQASAGSNAANVLNQLEINNNTGVASILCNITEVLTEMNSQLKSLNSHPKNTQHVESLHTQKQLNPHTMTSRKSMTHTLAREPEEKCDSEVQEERNTDRAMQRNVFTDQDLSCNFQNGNIETQYEGFGVPNENSHGFTNFPPQVSQSVSLPQISTFRPEVQDGAPQQDPRIITRTQNSRPWPVQERRQNFNHCQSSYTQNNNSVELHSRYPTQDVTAQYSRPQHSNMQRMSMRTARKNELGNIKISPYTGEGEWRIWHARFEAIAQRFGLNDQDKLDQLLPRIEGGAAVFVFTQLPSYFLTDYQRLIQELNVRYRVIETPRSFAAKFSRRSQRVGETAEQYAADLKTLYDKAHGYRDRQVREEDLVRRFLDGLRDDDVRFDIEFHKEPSTIDEAVFHVVNFIQTRGRRERVREGVRRVEGALSDVPFPEVTPNWKANKDPEDTKFKEECQKGDKDYTTEKIQHLLGNLMKRLDHIEQQTIRSKDKKTSQKREKTFECFHCHEIGHMARECPKRSQNQSRNLTEGDSRQNRQAEHLNYRGPALAAKERSN